jgi:hypothetical protein
MKLWRQVFSFSTRAPETEMSRPEIEPWPPRWEASTLAKIYSKSQLVVIRYIYMSLRQCVIFVDSF